MRPRVDADIRWQMRGCRAREEKMPWSKKNLIVLIVTQTRLSDRILREVLRDPRSTIMTRRSARYYNADVHSSVFPFSLARQRSDDDNDSDNDGDGDDVDDLE